MQKVPEGIKATLLLFSLCAFNKSVFALLGRLIRFTQFRFKVELSEGH